MYCMCSKNVLFNRQNLFQSFQESHRELWCGLIREITFYIISEIWRWFEAVFVLENGEGGGGA